MRAVSLYIVVENIKLKPKTIGGLEISDSIDSDNRYLKGKIISKGDLCPPDEILKVGDIVYNTTDTTAATVTAVDSDTTLSISEDIMAASETYTIYRGQPGACVLYVGQTGNLKVQ